MSALEQYRRQPLDAACPGLPRKPLDTTIGQLLARYCPGGRQGDSKQNNDEKMDQLCWPFDGRGCAPVRYHAHRPMEEVQGFGSIVYLLLTYGTCIHKTRRSALAYLLTPNPFTLLLGREWTYVATVHSSSHQEMMRASDQLHTTSFC